MPVVKGETVKAKSISNHTWNADLVYFDGPLVSLFKDDDDIDFLYIWVDCDSRKNRWMIIPVSRKDLQDYLTQNIALSQIAKNSKEIFFYDITAKLRRHNFIRTTVSRLPASYMPEADSLLYEEISTEAAKKLASDLPKTYEIGLDEELYLEELGIIPRLYQQLYSFHYGLEHLSRPAVKDTLENLMSKWTGGFSAVNLFTGLRSVMPSIHRSRITELRYNSPGHIQLSLLPAMAEKIESASRKIESPQSYEKFEQLYKDIRSFFRDSGISGFEDERGSKEEKLSPAHMEQLKSYIAQFIGLLGWTKYQDSFMAINAGPVAQMRALLAYYRRLRKLRKFVRMDKIQLGKSKIKSGTNNHSEQN